MNLHEHMQNGHQLEDYVEFWNSEHGQEVVGGMLVSYNSHLLLYMHTYSLIFHDDINHSSTLFCEALCNHYYCHTSSYLVWTSRAYNLYAY